MKNQYSGNQNPDENIQIQQEYGEEFELSQSGEISQESIEIDNNSSQESPIKKNQASPQIPNLESIILSEKKFHQSKNLSQNQYLQKKGNLIDENQKNKPMIQLFEQKFEQINLRIKNPKTKTTLAIEMLQNDQQQLYFNRMYSESQSMEQLVISNQNVGSSCKKENHEIDSIIVNQESQNQYAGISVNNDKVSYMPLKPLYRKSKSTSILISQNLNLESSEKVNKLISNIPFKSANQQQFENFILQIKNQKENQQNYENLGNQELDKRQIENQNNDIFIIDEFEIISKQNNEYSNDKSKQQYHQAKQDIKKKKTLNQKKSFDHININEFKGALNYTQIQDYKLGKMLGQGAYALVREAIHLQTGQKVAIKIYDKFKLNQNPQIKKSVYREISILSKLSKSFCNFLNNDEVEQNQKLQFNCHPSLVKLYDAIDTHRQLFLVLENCQGKMLNQVMKQEGTTTILMTKNNLPEEICAKILYQLLQAIDHCHQMNISHRDIKLENILVNMNSENIDTKIIDFGFATQTQSFEQKLTAICGTPAFMAPELCSRKPYNGPATDMWALGIVLYTILFGKQPFKAKTEADLFQKIIKESVSFPQSSHPDFQNEKRAQQDNNNNNQQVEKTCNKTLQSQEHLKSSEKLNYQRKQLKLKSNKCSNPFNQKPKLSTQQEATNRESIQSPMKKQINNSLKKQTINDFSNKALRNIIEKRVDTQKKTISLKKTLNYENEENSLTINYSKDAKRIVLDLLQVDSSKRLRADEILQKYRMWFENNIQQ